MNLISWFYWRLYKYPFFVIDSSFVRSLVVVRVARMGGASVGIGLLVITCCRFCLLLSAAAAVVVFAAGCLFSYNKWNVLGRCG